MTLAAKLEFYNIIMYTKAKLYYDMLKVSIKYNSDHCRGIKSDGVHWNGWKRSRECFSMKDKQWKNVGTDPWTKKTRSEKMDHPFHNQIFYQLTGPGPIKCFSA